LRGSYASYEKGGGCSAKPPEDRPELMNQFKHVMYSGNEGDADKAFDDLIERCNELQYGNFVKWVVVSTYSFPC